MVDFEAVVPQGKEVYSYYGIRDPREIKEEKLLELNWIDDPYLSHFRFKDVTKILPFSDPGCPNGGICSDNLQTLVKMSMTQETDVSRKPKEFIQLLIPENVTVSETESIKELILKNETTA